jgi:transposase-like protein
MVERPLVPGQKGRVRSRAVARVTVENLRPMLNEHIEQNATLNTDEAVVYHFVGKEFEDHKVVTHKTKQYVRLAEDGKKVTTNTVESYYALLKRGVHGTYHHVSREHLHRYLNEFDFRYNARDITDSERAERALSGFDGKHLTYRGSCGKADAKSAV